MHEYSSVSASSYDPGALVAKLNEAAAEGWDVVAIVPTGGDVSAFLRRSSGEAAAEGVDSTGEMELVGATAAEEIVVEEPDAASATEGWTGGEAGAADAALAGAAAETADGVDSATDVIDVAEVTEAPAAAVAAATPAAVDEPAGWAVAPDSANEAAPAAEEIPVVSAAPAAAAAESAPVTEPSPAPAPGPAPAPAPEPAPVVTTPAGWYPDPSTRYELRYWDGTQWTEHVARQGQQFTDPPVR